MLPKYYRFHVVNNTGQTATFNDGALLALRISPWKFTSAGAVEYGTTITDDAGFDAGETIADGAASEGGVNDNTSNLYVGLNGYFEATHDLDAAVGTWDLYIEGSDDNTNWPSDSDDFDLEIDLDMVRRMTIDNSAVDKSRAVNFTWE